MQNDSIKKHLWGIEIIWADKDEYKGKILVFEKENYSTEMHMHKESSKSWFINSGSATVRWIDTSTGQTYEKSLKEGDTFDVAACTPVMLQANTQGTSVAEVSNQKNNDLIILAQTMQVEEKEKENVKESV